MMPGRGIIPEFNQGGSIGDQWTQYGQRIGEQNKDVLSGGFTSPVIEADEGQNTQQQTQQTNQTQVAATTIVCRTTSVTFSSI